MFARQLTLCSFLLLIGCGKSVPPLVGPGGVEGSYSFGAGSAAKPGLGKGSIYFSDKRFVVWVNGKKATGEARTTAAGISCRGTITRDGAEPIAFSYSIKPEQSGSVVIADKTFDLTDGNLFLVDCTSDELRILQLERTFDDVRFAVGADTGEHIRNSLRNDTDVCGFFSPDSQGAVAGR